MAESFRGYTNFSTADENVTGESLVSLGQEELKDMGIQSAGHRLVILKNIYNMKLRHNVSIEPEDYVPPCKHERGINS